MADVCRTLSCEKKALYLSLLATIFMCVLGITSGLLIGSHAIFLDGVFSMFSAGMTALSLMTSYLISREDDEYFQFGYSHLEPLMNVLNGVALLGMCLYACSQAWSFMAVGGRYIELDIAIYYALFSTVFCTAIYVMEIRIGLKSDSVLVQFDAKEWLVDAVLSFTLLLGFSGAKLCEHLGYMEASLYIDPVLMFVMALLTCVIPLKVLHKSTCELLRVAPNDKMASRVEKIILEIEKETGVLACESHLAKYGRRYELEINVLLMKGHDWSIGRQDKLRAYLFSMLRSKLDTMWLSVCFTQQRRWL